jgi:hypothetical protein
LKPAILTLTFVLAIGLSAYIDIFLPILWFVLHFRKDDPWILHFCGSIISWLLIDLGQWRGGTGSQLARKRFQIISSFSFLPWKSSLAVTMSLLKLPLPNRLTCHACHGFSVLWVTLSLVLAILSLSLFLSCPFSFPFFLPPLLRHGRGLLAVFWVFSFIVTCTS